MSQFEEWDRAHWDVPKDPSKCAKSLVRTGQLLSKGSSDEDVQRDREAFCAYAKWHLSKYHPETWRALNREYDLVSYVRRESSTIAPVTNGQGASLSPPAAKAARKRGTPEEKAIERRQLLGLPIEDLVAQVTKSPDQLMAFCRAPDNYGVLALRLVIEICRPDCTAGLVLSQILFWHCRGRNGRTRIGKQSWLRRTHAELARETGLTTDQVRGALNRLEKMGLCERQRGCRTGLLNPCLEEIARRVWAAIQRGERDG